MLKDRKLFVCVLVIFDSLYANIATAAGTGTSMILAVSVDAVR